jgi:hypothetical protein
MQNRYFQEHYKLLFNGHVQDSTEFRRTDMSRPGAAHDAVDHKVLTYVEYRAVPGVFQNIDLPPPSPPSECVLPPQQRRGGTHSPGGEGVGGSIFWKTPAIGLASYSLISLRCRV